MADKTLVTESRLRGLVSSALEQVVGVAASAYGRRVGQSEAMKTLFRRIGTGWIATMVSALGLTGLGAVLSDKDLLRGPMEKLGFPSALIDAITEQAGDFFEGLSAERLHQMTEPEAEQAIKDHAAKKAAELSAKVDKKISETKTFEQAYRLLSDLQKKQLVEYLDAMPEGVKESWVKSYRPRLILAQDIADALRMTRNWPGFLAYLDDIFPVKLEPKAQVAVLDLVGHVTRFAAKAAEDFVADPKKALKDVAAGIDVGTAKLKKENDEREKELVKLRRGY